MDMFDGFVFLEEKKKSLIPILCQYDFLSALTAAFSITSWRKNRGAQESCLALNSAMVENDRTEWSYGRFRSEEHTSELQSRE